MTERKSLSEAKLIVIKIGTSTLTDKNGVLDADKLQMLTAQMARLKKSGKDIIFVTSGAVGSGMGHLGLTEKPKNIPKKQALAAIGQGLLMQNYEKMFSEYGITVAQILLTKDDFTMRERYVNARNTIHALLRYGALPIINENDTVAFDEIKLGDNDTLAALLAGLVGADLLILLSDVDGLYTANPHTDPTAKKIDIVEKVTDEITLLAGGTGTKLGSGGMVTKLTAAKIAGEQGVPMALAHGAEQEILLRICNGENVGTLFSANDRPLGGKKGWLAFGSRANGVLIVDDGAVEAILHMGKSLLPKGVKAVDGDFDRGEVVSIVTESGVEIAKGFSAHSSDDLKKIMGYHTSKVAEILGEDAEVEAVHRDNMSVR